MDEKVNDPTLQTIWETLSKIDCSEHTEDKGGLTYLSWAWCWQLLVENFAFAQYEFADNETHADGSMTVHCTVIIGACRRSMWLPVMDHRNRALVNPDSRSISDSKMRCLTKCIAMFGLGHYIYAGEDLPFAPQEESGDESLGEMIQRTGSMVAAPPAASEDADREDADREDADEPPIPQNEKDAESWVKVAVSFIDEFCDSYDGLKAYWAANSESIAAVEKYPGPYAALRNHFAEARGKLQKKESDE